MKLTGFACECAGFLAVGSSTRKKKPQEEQVKCFMTTYGRRLDDIPNELPAHCKATWGQSAIQNNILKIKFEKK